MLYWYDFVVLGKICVQAMNNDGSFGDVFKSFQSDLEQVLEQALGFRVKEMIEAHA